MAEDLAVFDEQTAREMLAAFKQLQASGLLEPDLKARDQRGNPGKTITHQQPPIFVRNDSGQTVPPYAFMQPAGTVNVTDSFCYVSVQKPIHSSNFRCPLLINGIYEIESGAYGVAQQGPVYSLLGVPGLSLGERLASVDDEWFAEYGSMYTVIGTDTTAIADDIYKVMFDTSTARGRTNAGGITAGATGTVKLYKADGTLGTINYTAETFVSSIAGNTEIVLLSQYGRWLALGLC